MRPHRAVTLGALVLSATLAQAAPVTEGKPAPDFTANTLAGKTLRLSALRGRVVLLDFWAPDCPPCKIEMPVLQRWHRQYARRGLVVVGITEMNPTAAAIRAAIRERGVTYPITLDPGERIFHRYGLQAHPTTILIDRAGKVVRCEAGYLRGDEKPIERALLPLLDPPANARGGAAHGKATRRREARR